MAVNYLLRNTAMPGYWQAFGIEVAFATWTTLALNSLPIVSSFDKI